MVFLKSNNGGVLVLFAFLFPFLILLFSLAFDSSRYNILQARQIDAIQQAGLSIAIDDVSNSGIQPELSRIKNYLSYFVGDVASSFDVEANVYNLVDEESIPYQILETKSTSVIAPIFRGSNDDTYTGFSPVQRVVLPTDAGLIRLKNTKTSEPADYVFVIDFSHSMNNGFEQENPNTPSLGQSKLDAVKIITAKLIINILEGEQKSSISIVPYSIGVMTWLRDSVNQVGGTAASCSFSGAVNAEYKSAVDNLWFWYNKSGLYQQGNDINLGTHYVDFKRMNNIDYTSLHQRLFEASRWTAHLWGYYNKTLKDTRGAWCSDLPIEIVNENYSWVTKTCDDSITSRLLNYKPEGIRYPVSDIGGDGTLGYFVYNESRFKSAIELMLSAERNMSILNIETFDYEKTFSDGFVFKEINTVEYPLLISPKYSPSPSFFAHEAYVPSPNGEGIIAPFQYMCQQNFHTSFLSSPLNDRVSASKRVRQNIPPNNYLINLTNDKRILNELGSMKTSDGSDSTMGLLRALPVISQGTNKRKVIIVISDGLDVNMTAGPFKGNGPGIFSDYMHKEKRFCDDIRKGLSLYSENTESTDMYFISLASKFELNDAKLSAKKWEEYCVGDGNAFTAEDYESLDKILSGISSNEEINYVDKK